MHIVVCLDDKNGMLFNHRRLSSDQVVSRRIVENHSGNLWMNGYSAKLFTAFEIFQDEDFLNKAAEDDTCFAETPAFTQMAEKIQSITVYRWNRVYPSDEKLPVDFLTSWRRIESVDFPGNSHKNITEEKYIR